MISLPVVGVLALTPTGGKPAKCVADVVIAICCFTAAGFAGATPVTMVAATKIAASIQSFVLIAAPFD